MNNPAKAWAVCAPLGYPLVNTVSSTRRGAVVNWLVTDAKIMVWATASDQQIEAMWKRHSPEHQVTLQQVEVTVLPEPAKVQ